MGQPTSPDAHPEMRNILDEALSQIAAGNRGIFYECDTPAQAWRYRTNAATVIKRDRDLSVQLYAPTHAMHGKSVYDQLAIHVCDKDGNIAHGRVQPGCRFLRVMLREEFMVRTGRMTVIPSGDATPKPGF